MRLKNLELYGFKSFGKKVSIDFASQITGIVGPNGSGKSNIAEGFRFVLGEQSIKSMRGKKGEDLIFNGSTDAGKANRASVKLTFDNNKRILPIDFDEVSIERVVYRDGVNEYAINGTKVRLKDIQELLASAHIGSSGHHIISQGEADRILHASIKERREMIEDALGIKVYQYKKEESERKLERTALNIKEVESLRREIAPHLRFLKKQVEKLEKSKVIREELVLLAREYFKREERYILDTKRILHEEKQPLQTELASLGVRLQETKRLVTESQQEKEVAPEIILLEERLGEARKHKDELSRELGRIEGEIAYILRSVQKEESISKEQSNKTILLSEVETLHNKITTEIERGESLNTLESLRATLYEVVKLVTTFINSNRHSATSTIIENLKKELSYLEEKKNSIAEKCKDAISSESELVASYELKRKEMERVKDETKEAEKEVFRIVARQNELHAHLDRVITKESGLRFDEENFKNDIGEVGKIAGLEAVRFDDVSVQVEEGRTAQHERRKHVERLKIRLEEMGISGGEEVFKEYKETEERDKFLEQELVDLAKASEDLRNLIVDLTEKLDQEFKIGVGKINDAFGSFFSLMFGGGRASLKLVKQEKRKRALLLGEDDESGEEMAEVVETEEGVDIEISLPHKKIKGLMMLSGGERALTSIALLFAISQVNPPPFVILDETDAALDEANSRKYGDMVESLAGHSQLIVITHNRETMSRAGMLYGITMGKDAISKLLSVGFEDAVAVAK